MKADIWRQLKEFQSSPNPTLPFPPSLSSEDRKYVHKIAVNLDMDTKSTGNKRDGTRYVVVYKKTSRTGAAAAPPLGPLLHLPPAVRSLIDGFLARHPLDRIQHFDPLRAQASAPTPAPAPALPPASRVLHPPARPLYLTNPKYRAMLPVRGRLPISTQRPHILSLLSSHQVLVLSGATGCGKVRTDTLHILLAERS